MTVPLHVQSYTEITLLNLCFKLNALEEPGFYCHYSQLNSHLDLWLCDFKKALPFSEPHFPKSLTRNPAGMKFRDFLDRQIEV